MTDTEAVIGDLLPQERKASISKADIKRLAEDIKEHSLQFSIIVYDGVVVDGLKRIEAYKYLKLDKIPAYVPESYGELCLRLEAVREGRELEMPRRIELAMDSWPAQVKWVRDKKVYVGAHKKGPDGPFKGVTVRQLLSRALGMSEGRCELLMTLLRQARVDPEARKWIEDIKDGTGSLHGYQAWRLRQIRNQQWPTASGEEIRNVMERGLRTLATTAEAMGRFGPITGLPLTDRLYVATQLNERARALKALSNLILKEINEEVEEQ